MNNSPIFSTPLTDFGYIMAPNYRQFPYNNLCAKLEMKFMDCTEAYGIHKAREKCADLLYDMNECTQGTFQLKRAIAIRKQRLKLYKEGKLSKPFDEYPPLDSYMYL